MKNIFIFDNSRVTDRDHHVLALSEDGVSVASISFDDWTFPHSRFVMCVDEHFDATGALAAKVDDTHAEVYAEFNDRFGAGNWRAVWIEQPMQDPGCLDALRAHHASLVAKLTKRKADFIEMLFAGMSAPTDLQPVAQH
ncbi:MAG TPA: hypothetical protein VF534_04325 [Paraburkholderia sp.]